MAIFQKFQGYIHEAKRNAESFGFRVKSKEAMEKVVHAFLAGRLPNAIDMGGFYWRVQRELFHFGLTHKTYYVTAELAKALVESNYALTLEDLQACRFPYASFDVALEPLEIDGYQMKGFLVIPPMTTPSVDAIMEVAIRSARSLGATEGKNAYAYSQFPVNMSVCHGSQTTCIDFKKYGGMNIDDAVEDMLKGYENVENKREIRAYVKLSIGVMLYAGMAGSESRPFAAQTSKAFGTENGELLGETFAASPSWHMRKACFHVLSHPRFKRNADGTPRRIWVRSCEVAKDKDMSFPDEKSETIGSQP